MGRGDAPHAWAPARRSRRPALIRARAGAAKIRRAIYLVEVASRYGDAWIENYLRDTNADYNAGLPRIAFKMATGSGKTVVMGMLMAWQALNKLENRQDARFTDAFLIVTPGITIRDRLRVLLPTDPDNYYRERDLLPPDLLERLGQARITENKRHAFRIDDLRCTGASVKFLSLEPLLGPLPNLDLAGIDWVIFHQPRDVFENERCNGGAVAGYV